jgi:hypothetical protein
LASILDRTFFVRRRPAVPRQQKYRRDSLKQGDNCRN